MNRDEDYGYDDRPTRYDVQPTLTEDEAEEAQSERDLQDLHDAEDADIRRAIR